MLSVIMLSVVVLSVVMLSIFMLSVVMLSVVMLSVFTLSVVMLSVFMFSVMAPCVVVALSSKLNQVEKRASADELTKTYNKNIFFLQKLLQDVNDEKRRKNGATTFSITTLVLMTLVGKTRSGASLTKYIMVRVVIG